MRTVCKSCKISKKNQQGGEKKIKEVRVRLYVLQSYGRNLDGLSLNYLALTPTHNSN